MESTACDVVLVKDISTGMGSCYKTLALEISSHSLEQFLFCTNICKVLPAFLFLQPMLNFSCRLNLRSKFFCINFIEPNSRELKGCTEIFFLKGS